MAGWTIRPEAVSLTCHSECVAFRRYVKTVLESLHSVGLPTLLRWTDDSERSGTASEIDTALKSLPDAAGRGVARASLQFELDDGSRGGLLGSARFNPDQDGMAFASLNLRRLTRKADNAATLVAFQDRCSALAQELLGRVGLYSVDLVAEDGGLRCLPEVPLVEGASHLVATNQDEVEASYDQPEAFWNADWVRVAERDGQILMKRAMDVVCGPEYLARVLGGQWAMARAAKPDLTRYERPEVDPAEKKIFEAGAARLEPVGYSAAEQLLEYSCVVQEGEHLPGWEIYSLANIVEQGRTSDGRGVKTVRVVFLDEESARREKRPLLDVGCKVFFTAADGSLKALTD